MKDLSLMSALLRLQLIYFADPLLLQQDEFSDCNLVNFFGKNDRVFSSSRFLAPINVDMVGSFIHIELLAPFGGEARLMLR